MVLPDRPFAGGPPPPELLAALGIAPLPGGAPMPGPALQGDPMAGGPPMAAPMAAPMLPPDPMMSPPGMVPPGAGPVGMAAPAPAPVLPPPPPPPLMMPPTLAMPDPMRALDDLLKPPPQPKYPPGYDKPDKPDKDEIISLAEEGREANAEFIQQVSDTLARLRPSSGFGGFFEKDRYAIAAGVMEQYRSPALLAAHNRQVSYLASRPVNYSVEVYDPELYADAQKLEDAAYHFRSMHEKRWVAAGNPVLAQCEAWDLLTYGMVIKRVTLNPADTKCPVKSVLIDPATVYPVWGRAGVLNELEAVYRIVTMPVRQVLVDYAKVGDLKKKLKDAIGDRLKEFGDRADVTVVEYWDTWWCGAFLLDGGVEIKPLTAHEYGCVPYIIQYGPGGEPMHNRSPEPSGGDIHDYATFDSSSGAERRYKATPFIEPFKYQHDLQEAVKSRALTNVLKSFNPPYIVERTNAAAKGEMPEIENWEGGKTETEAGEENIKLLPESANRDVGLVFQLMDQDRSANPLDPSSDGMPDKSNISGTARQGMAEVGHEMREMWVRSLESLHGREATHTICKLWRNFGHESRYAEGKKKPFYVPTRNPNAPDARAFELTPEVIDNVDAEFTASMNSLKLSEMIPFAQAMAMLGPESQTPIFTLADIARKAGVTDIARVMQENETYRLMKKVMDLEEMGKLVLAPEAMEEAIMVAIESGDMALAARLQRRMQVWEQAVAGPMQAKIQQSVAPPQPPPGPQPNLGAGVAGGAPPPYAMQGQGNGSQGGPVGAPPGPQGQ